MTPEKLRFVEYYVDIAVKGLIAVAISFGGYHFKKATDDIEELKKLNAEKTTKISILEVAQVGISKQIDRIESKLDKLIERAK